MRLAPQLSACLSSRRKGRWVRGEPGTDCTRNTPFFRQTGDTAPRQSRWWRYARCHASDYSRDACAAVLQEKLLRCCCRRRFRVVVVLLRPSTASRVGTSSYGINIKPQQLSRLCVCDFKRTAGLLIDDGYPRFHIFISRLVAASCASISSHLRPHLISRRLLSFLLGRVFSAMVNIHGRRCQHEDCDKQPTFGRKGGKVSQSGFLFFVRSERNRQQFLIGDYYMIVFSRYFRCYRYAAVSIVL